jgi:hypothetical protein
MTLNHIIQYHNMTKTMIDTSKYEPDTILNSDVTASMLLLVVLLHSPIWSRCGNIRASI